MLAVTCCAVELIDSECDVVPPWKILQPLQLRMKIDKHSTPEHCTREPSSTWQLCCTCCRCCIPELSTVYWCQTIQKASWARRRGSGMIPKTILCCGARALFHSSAWCMWSFQRRGFYTCFLCLGWQTKTTKPVLEVGFFCVARCVWKTPGWSCFGEGNSADSFFFQLMTNKWK